MQDGFVPDSDIGTGVYYLDYRLQNYMTELIKQSSKPESER